MKATLSLGAIGNASSLFLAISFMLCVAGDLLMPQHAMYPVWEKLLPGFVWLSWGSFFLGLIESYAWGWYFTLIWVPLYNVIAGRQIRAEG